ncbi:ABC transporter permease [Planococcus glaciei]|nr:ABC transporter permease [Planococcus glaciei]
MYAFLKKDILVLVRNRTELAVLLAMPFLLIAILGFALSGLLSGNSEALLMEVAIVQEDDEQQGLTRFAEALEKSEMPAAEKSRLKEAAETTSPATLLQEILKGESLSSLVKVHEMDAAAAKRALEQEEIVATLTIPEDFTFQALQKMLLGAGDGSELQLMISDQAATQAEVFQSILDEIVQSLNFESAIFRTGVEAGAEETQPQFGGVESISAAEPISSFQYYTIGMAVMFALFVSGIISSMAYMEKKAICLPTDIAVEPSSVHLFNWKGDFCRSYCVMPVFDFIFLFFTDFSGIRFDGFVILAGHAVDCCQFGRLRRGIGCFLNFVDDAF